MIRCPHCQQIAMRLARYQGEREIWACAHCGEESPLLDCHRCERRGVRRAGTTALQVEWWACHSCDVPQYRCPGCGRSWLEPSPDGHWCCPQCGHRQPEVGSPLKTGGAEASR